MSDLVADLPSWFGYIFFFLFGSLLGSFANVVIYRLPKGESVVKPRSRCGGCGHQVAWYDNIPMISWLILRGRCRVCQASFSFRYFMVELIMATLFATTFHFFGWSWLLVEYLIFVFGLVTCSFIDLDHMILPDVFTLSGIVIGLVGAFLNPERYFWEAFAGVMMGGGFLWGTAYIYFLITKKEGMGGGDIKLIAWIGAVLGWKAIPFVIFSSALIGTFVGLYVARGSKDRMKTMIPYGPFLAAGAIVYLLGGQTLGQWYLSLFLPGLL